MKRPKTVKPRTVEQYVDLVKQAVFEVEDIRAAIEYDDETHLLGLDVEPV